MAGRLTTEQARSLAAQRKKHGGGRRRRAEEDEIKAALDVAMSVKDVVDRLKASVQKDMDWAIALWLAYRWGRPIERQEWSGPGGDALSVVVRPIDYRVAAAPLATGSEPDHAGSSEDQDPGGGQALGEDGPGG